MIIPTDSLHAFYNRTDKPARYLSISTQLHQAFFDAVGETDRTDPFGSMPGPEAMARIGKLARRFDMHFFNSHRRHRGAARTTARNQRELQRTIYEDQ